MALLQWKQFSRDISTGGNFTGSLNITGSVFLNGIDLSKTIDTSVFQYSGSSTNINGGLTLNLDDPDNTFKILSGGKPIFEITNSGSLQFTPQDTPPPAEPGSIYYGTDRTFYFGV